MSDAVFLMLWLCPAFIALCVAFGAIKDDEPVYGVIFIAVAIIPFAAMIGLVVAFIYGGFWGAIKIVEKSWRR